MSKSKGNAYERKVCRELSIWWSEGERDDLFWKTSNSGGRATTRAKGGKKTVNSHGDIAATDLSAQPLIDLITFEIKRGYNKFSIQDLMDKPNKAAEQKYEEWFRKVGASRVLAGTPYWMLIAQRDRRESLLFIPNQLYNKLDYIASRKVKLITEKFGLIVCTLFSEFIRLVEPEEIRSLKK